MPNPLRRDLPNGAFHFMSRAVDGGHLFVEDDDNRHYLALLAQVVARHEWRVLTYALMGNHLHMLVVADVARLSAGAQWMHWQYAEHFKRRNDLHRGHVFGGRPKTKPIGDDAYFLAVVRYIARNPVGVFCDRPEDYRWSAHAALCGSAPTPSFVNRTELLSWFGRAGAMAYRALVDGRETGAHADVCRWVAQPPADRPPLDAIVGDGDPASLLEAHDVWHYSMREIARAAGRSFSTTRRSIIRARESMGLAR